MPRSFSRKDNHRKSLLRNLITSLVLYEEIKTTQTKAKEVKPLIEKLINKVSKIDKLTARRLLMGYLFDEKATLKVIEVLIPRYKKMKFGFVSIYRLGPRLGDSADLAMIKLAPGKEEITKEISEDKVINAKKTAGSKAEPTNEKAPSPKKSKN